MRGSKNAALPILAACVLAADEVVLENLPQIRDVSQTLEILRELGCSVTLTGRTAVIDSRDMQAAALCGEAVRKMRSSILFLGAMLGRSGVGRIAYPGGCAIGKRPIDLHLAAFRRMGVSIAEENEILDCRAERLQGCRIDLPFPSVGATENILLLAVCAEGVTVLHNAAREPEIVALVRFLRAMGAEIYGEGTGQCLPGIEGGASCCDGGRVFHDSCRPYRGRYVSLCRRHDRGRAMLEGTGARAAWRGFGSPADDGLSALLGGGRSPVDASAKAACCRDFFDYNGAVSCLPDGYAAFADGFIDIGERTLYD